MKKIYIYEADVIKKRQKLGDKIVNYVKLTRPEGLEEHWPEPGDIVNLYLPGNIIYMSHKVVKKYKDNIYIIDLEEFDDIKIDNKVDFLDDEGLKALLYLPRDINNEIEGLSKLSRSDVDLNKNLNLYFDFSYDLTCNEFFYKIIKTNVIKTIKDCIKDIDVWIDPWHHGFLKVYKNEPCIEEIIDKDYNSKDGIIKFKGIIEKEVKIFRLYFSTNIYKKKE